MNRNKQAMEKVAKIISRRDGESFEDSLALVEETMELIDQNLSEADEIFMDELGLEPDYLYEIIL